MLRISLATSAKYPSLTDDDRLLLQPLSERGFHPEPGVWDDRRYPWLSCDAVLIRSCWDYHLKPDQFLHWIASLEAAGVIIFNAAPLVRWNADKSYLRALDAKAIAVVPTFWPGPDDPVNLQDKLRELGWGKAVIKPRISATAHRTTLTTLAQAPLAQSLFDNLRHGSGVMVQKFMDGISSEGEWSLIFFGGRFSHAVLKTPKAGDFRVQNDFGGTSRLAGPPALVLDRATRAVGAVDPTVYARVDGVLENGEFLLKELELIEPALFLGLHPAAPTRFADAISQAVCTPG